MDQLSKSQSNKFKETTFSNGTRGRTEEKRVIYSPIRHSTPGQPGQALHATETKPHFYRRRCYSKKKRCNSAGCYRWSGHLSTLPGNTRPDSPRLQFGTPHCCPPLPTMTSSPLPGTVGESDKQQTTSNTELEQGKNTRKKDRSKKRRED